MSIKLLKRIVFVITICLISSFILINCSTRIIAKDDQELHNHPTILKMLKYNNLLRKNEGLPSHKISPELTKAAQDHAWHMARQHNLRLEDFEHIGKNGSPGKRAARYNYCGIVQENLARGYDTVQKVFSEWQKSPGHWDAIKSDTQDAGFGYAIADDGTTYWVAVYGSKFTKEVCKKSKSFLLINSSL